MPIDLVIDERDSKPGDLGDNNNNSSNGGGNGGGAGSGNGGHPGGRGNPDTTGHSSDNSSTPDQVSFTSYVFHSCFFFNYFCRFFEVLHDLKHSYEIEKKLWSLVQYQQMNFRF